MYAMFGQCWKVTKQSDHLLFLSPAQIASPVRKGRKGKAIPTEVETTEKEDVVEKEVVKVEKKGGRKAKSTPSIIETTKEEEVISWMNDNA